MFFVVSVFFLNLLFLIVPPGRILRENAAYCRLEMSGNPKLALTIMICFVVFYLFVS